MGLAFYPRGGSAHVARNLAHALPHVGWDVTILSGSVLGPGDASHFYRGLDVLPVDMTRAMTALDPMACDPPMHPSYEDRPHAPDRIFAALDQEDTERQTLAWCRALQSAGAAHYDVLHLHHLTPIYEAARRVAPHVPIIGHLHGTELLMLEAIEEDPHRWPYGPAWAQRLRSWAADAQQLIVQSESQIERAEQILGLEHFTLIPNGYDPELFFPRAVAHEEPVIVYVGRFTEVKRVPLLIEAFELARPGFNANASLKLVGGFPGEWEGEHPRDAIARTHARNVELAGWHDHDELPAMLNAADVIVLPSVREQFGQVLVEAMACGLPAIAVDAHGPADIVKHGVTGWLVEPDDRHGLANALVEAVNRPGERKRRGENAAQDVQQRYAWPVLANEVAELYDATILRTNAAQTA
jgi:glycosyltransferase involved in cell wall biosynthesis